MTLYSMVGCTMLIANCGAQVLTVPVLDQSVLLLDGLPSKAMSPICPCYLTHSWSNGWQTPGRVPRAGGPARHASGAHCCSEIPHRLAWDLTEPSYRVWPLGGSAGVLVAERLCIGRRRLTHSAPLFTPTKRASWWQ